MVNVGATPVTVKVKGWLAAGATPLEAPIVSGKVPAWVAVPLKVAVPLPLFTNAIPFGRVPVSVIPGKGTPVAVTVNDPNTLAVNVVLLALVIVGGVPAPCGICTTNTSPRPSTPSVPVPAAPPEVVPKGVPLALLPAISEQKATKFPVWETTPMAFCTMKVWDFPLLNV